MSFKQTLPFRDGHPIRDDLQAYLDLELDQQVTLELENHLSSCTACQNEIRRLESLVTRLETLPDIPITNDYSGRILANIKEIQRVPTGLTWTLLVEGIAAGVVLGLLIPAIKSSVWTPRLLEIQLEVRAAINIFLTQVASSWILWWAKLQLDFTQIIKSLSSPISLTGSFPSSWILILVGAGAGLFTNLILLNSRFQYRKKESNG